MEELSQNQFEALEKGDESAFEEIYRQYYEPVYYLALKILQRPHDAEDAVQQTFLRAFENIKTVKNYQSFRTWLFPVLTLAIIAIIVAPDPEMRNVQAPFSWATSCSI